jgi:uncharacterized protein involved in outer membrane biogenesis
LVAVKAVAKFWLWITVPFLLGLAFAVCESQGWPFLVAPLQTLLQQKMGRTVRLRPAEASTEGPHAPVVLHLWGGVTLNSPLLQIGAPGWSQAPHLLVARDVQVRLRYTDLWHSYRGQRMVVQSLKASQMDVVLQRDAEGRVSWQLAASDHAPVIPRLEAVAINDGQLHYDDSVLALRLNAELQLVSNVLQVVASGDYRTQPFQLSLTSTGGLPWESGTGDGTPVAVKLVARAGRASLDFGGTANNLLHMNGLDGRFTVEGPSLAAVGAPFGVTLPTTHAFKAMGSVTRADTVWGIVLGYAQVGTSRLGGSFTFDSSAPTPRLTGTLEGTSLKLLDLAPALGVSGTPPLAGKATKVLPVRMFDLAALRAMNADVLVRLQQVDSITGLLEPLRPFNAHLLLADGVLTLKEIDTRTGQGHMAGTLSLNGQKDRAHWSATLNWDGVKLERWIRQKRRVGLPPYISGQLQGYATVQGSGRSTAEILATLQGDVGAYVVNGKVSHLLVEAGGLDVAESLGVYLQGDKALVLNCALADLSVAAGVVRPRVLVLDTSDSTLWMDGTLSLANETLDLRAVVAPKDFSPLTLRAPLRIGGTFAHVVVGVEKRALGIKLGSTLLLGLINPLAAIIPLVDPGSRNEAQRYATSCRTRLHGKLQRGVSKLRVLP